MGKAGLCGCIGQRAAREKSGPRSLIEVSRTACESCGCYYIELQAMQAMYAIPWYMRHGDCGRSIGGEQAAAATFLAGISYITDRHHTYFLHSSAPSCLRLAASSLFSRMLTFCFPPHIRKLSFDIETSAPTGIKARAVAILWRSPEFTIHVLGRRPKSWHTTFGRLETSFCLRCCCAV